MRTLLKILLGSFSVLNLTQCMPLTQAQLALNSGSTLKRGSQMMGGNKFGGSSFGATQPPMPPAPPAAHSMRLSYWQQTGYGAYYGEERHGHYTASGEPFDMNGWTAAHPSLPFGTVVRVTNLNNGRYADVRINDRCGHAARVIDVAKVAAFQLDMIQPGVVPVAIRAWEPGAW